MPIAITKGRYSIFINSLEKHFTTDQISIIEQVFKEHLKFNPNEKTRTEEELKREAERRRKLKEQGISTYVSSGGKAVYERKRRGD